MLSQALLGGRLSKSHLGRHCNLQIHKLSRLLESRKSTILKSKKNRNAELNMVSARGLGLVAAFLGWSSWRLSGGCKLEVAWLKVA